MTGRTEIFLQVLRSTLKESQKNLGLGHNGVEDDESLNEIVRLVLSLQDRYGRLLDFIP